MLPLPGPLAPLDPHKTRALTTVYAPRKLKTRNRTAQSRMLDDNIHIKPGLSPFHPLPAIGQKIERSKTKIIVFDLNKSDSSENRLVKVHDVLKPLTPLRIHGFTRKGSLEHMDLKKPQQLIRENTYDVIEPIYVNTASRTLKKNDSSISKIALTNIKSTGNKEDPKVSPKTRFKKAAMQVAKLSIMPETGKLLCLRERETFTIYQNKDDRSVCKLEELPKSPAEKLNEISEIFQNLDMKGRHRDRMKKENCWF